jgi:hypothetical protein
MILKLYFCSMNFKIGDKVRFLNEKGEGIVSKIINKTTVGITIEDGFELPFAVSQLLLIYDESRIQSSVKYVEEPPVVPLEKKNLKTSKIEEQEGIYLAFSPEKENDIAHSDFNVWMINNTSYQLLFTYSIFSNDGFKTFETGHIDAFEHELIETIDRKLLSESSTFKIDALFFDEKEHTHQLPISEVIKLKPIKLYKENAFSENRFISEKSLIINVCELNGLKSEDQYRPDIDLSKILFQKQTKTDTSKKSKPHVSNNPAYEMEINLHIEELMENYSGMSNAEIIQIQLKHFQNALDKAINDRCRSLVVIHGVGNGRLKQEVRAIITSYKNLKMHDGSYSKYGFGATEIIIN